MLVPEVAVPGGMKNQDTQQPTASTSHQQTAMAFSTVTDQDLQHMDVQFLPSEEPAPPPPPVRPVVESSPPPSYSVIFDNLDFYSHTHHQSISKSNKSLHWTHHMAVEDRISTHHLSSEKPQQSIMEYDILKSLPGPDTESKIRREFIILGSRAVTKHLDAFKPLSNVVIHHIPHPYSEEMSKPSVHVSSVLGKCPRSCHYTFR